MPTLRTATLRGRRTGWPAIMFLLLALALTTAGCGRFAAHRLAQSPNTYPKWFAPAARVEIAFDEKILAPFPRHPVKVGPPTARLSYRVIEPAYYAFSVHSTNWMQRDIQHYRFTFKATLPGVPDPERSSPVGTVILLHGYGLSHFATAPWALRLAEAGWRCVLLDLRGHGQSTGRRIYFGTRESQDLSQLLDQLARTGQLATPVVAMGDSYGGALALRWKAEDARVTRAVAIAPYAVLSNAVLNIRSEYARWIPAAFPRAGMRHLPRVLGVSPEELDPLTVMAQNPVSALFVAGGEDQISPVSEVKRLYHQARPDSELIIVPEAAHESLPYFFWELGTPVLAWLQGERTSSLSTGDTCGAAAGTVPLPPATTPQSPTPVVPLAGPAESHPCH